MLAPHGASSFPLPAAGLPLTAFEEFMFLDDRSSHPMVIVARFDFSAGRPPANLADAFAATLRNEPLLTARISAPRFGRPRWLPADVPTLEWSDFSAAGSDSSSAAGPVPRLDPRVGPMIRARAGRSATGWSILVAVHHAACDGLGLVGFVERWLLRVVGGVEPRDRPRACDLDTLRGRGRVADSWIEFARMLPKLVKGLEGVKQFIGRDVAALGAPAAGPAAADASFDRSWRPAVTTATLDTESTARIDSLAGRRGVRSNDLLMGALLSAIGPDLAGAPGREPWIRLATPLSLRTREDAMLPAANRVSMVFLDRRPTDLPDADRLVRGLRDEMSLISGHRLGHILPLTLEAGRWCPGGLVRSTLRRRPQSTVVLSNLGRCFHRRPLVDETQAVRVGDSVLAGWWIVPPVRPGTALSVATHKTQGRRTIAFHVDESRVPLPSAATLLDRMIVTLLAAQADGMPAAATTCAGAVP